MIATQGYAQKNTYVPYGISTIAQASGGFPASTSASVALSGNRSASDGASPSIKGAASSPLSSGTLASLLKEQESKATSWNDVPTSPPDGATAWGLGYYLSSADKAMLTKATGYHFDSFGMTCDENGNRVECPANSYIGQISLERAGGALSGAITPDYLKDLFDRFAKHGEPLDQEWLTKSLDYLQTRTASGKA